MRPFFALSIDVICSWLYTWTGGIVYYEMLQIANGSVPWNNILKNIHVFLQITFIWDQCLWKYKLRYSISKSKLVISNSQYNHVCFICRGSIPQVSYLRLLFGNKLCIKWLRYRFGMSFWGELLMVNMIPTHSWLLLCTFSNHCVSYHTLTETISEM